MAPAVSSRWRATSPSLAARAIPGQFEIGIAALLEGGLSTRLPDIVRRGRA